MIEGAQRRVVLFTSQSGTAKKQRIRELARYSEERGRSVHLFSVGELMYQETGAQPGRILHFPLIQLELARRNVFRQIVAYASEHPTEDLYIDTHATFRWEDGVFAGFSAGEIRDLRPSTCICFVADVHEVKAGLRTADYPIPLSLRDIMLWREEEMLCSGLLASFADCPFYVLPSQMNVARVHRLLYRPEARRLYISYPMSNVPETSVRSDIDAFRTAFHEIDDAVVFDPAEITAEPVLLKNVDKYLAEHPGADGVPIQTALGTVTLSLPEVDEVRPHINSRTRSFDFRMVDQAQEIVAFVPVIDDSPFVAEGVTMEIAWAKLTAGKPLTLVWPAHQREPSLMIQADRKVSSIEEAANLFRA